MDKKIISLLRGLSIDMIDEAGSGHPGICLGAAPIIYTLFSRHLNINPNVPNWINRDKFVMSAGHGSALMYATLFLAGYPIKEEELRTFRKAGSRLTGHPERNLEIGVEVTTGPLGEGLATAVGLAMGEEYLSNSISKELFDNYTYVLCGDGDLMEGISYEAMSLAGSLKLGNLIVLYDSNNVSLDGSVTGIFNDNVLQRFDSCGWHTAIVSNGENVDAIDAAIKEAKKKNDRPSIIEIKTVIGAGSQYAGTNQVHGKPLSREDILSLKEKLELHEAPFKIGKESVTAFRTMINERVTPIYNEWVSKYDRLSSTNKLFKNNLIFLENNNLRINLNSINLTNNGEKEELRATNGRIMNIISNSTPIFLGGSADVSSSTKTELIGTKNFKVNGEYGKNIRFGVRENLMASVVNGLSLLNLKAFGSTFLTFSDYMKPGLRLAALMKIPSTFVFTHDSITIGEDGPTHQPIEQIGALRSIPNMYVFRPADLNEIIASWHYILNEQVPSCIIISKEKVYELSNSNKEEALKGAYIVRNEANKLDAIILATGSEVHIAVKLAEDLKDKKIDIRVVSVPCLEAFENQSVEYKNKILPENSKVIALEASNDSNWYKYVSNNDCFLKVDDFGISGSREEVLVNMQFDYETIKEKIIKLI